MTVRSREIPRWQTAGVVTCLVKPGRVCSVLRLKNVCRKSEVVLGRGWISMSV